MTTSSSSRKPLRRIACPQCGEKALQRIIYGLPNDDFDFDKYISGGCIPHPHDIGCRQCDWFGSRTELEEK